MSSTAFKDAMETMTMDPSLASVVRLEDLMRKADPRRLQELMSRVRRDGTNGLPLEGWNEEIMLEFQKLTKDPRALEYLKEKYLSGAAPREVLPGALRTATQDAHGAAADSTSCTSGRSCEGCPFCGRSSPDTEDAMLVDMDFDATSYYSDGSREWFSSQNAAVCEHGLERCQRCDVDHTAMNEAKMKEARRYAKFQRGIAEQPGYKRFWLRFSTMFDDDAWVRDLMFILNLAIMLEILVHSDYYSMQAIGATPYWPAFANNPVLGKMPFIEAGSLIITLNYATENGDSLQLATLTHMFFDLALHNIIATAMEVNTSGLGKSICDHYEDAELTVLQAFCDSAFQVIEQVLACRTTAFERKLDRGTTMELALWLSDTVGRSFASGEKSREPPHPLIYFAQRAYELTYGETYKCADENGKVNRWVIQEIRDELADIDIFEPVIVLQPPIRTKWREMFIFSEHEKGAENFVKITLYEDTIVSDIYRQYQDLVIMQKPHVDSDMSGNDFRLMVFEMFVEEDASKPSVLAMQKNDQESIKKEFLATKGKFPLFWCRRNMRLLLEEMSDVSGFRKFPEDEPIILRWLPAEQARFCIKVRADPRLDKTNENKELKFNITPTVKVRQLLNAFCEKRKIEGGKSLVLRSRPDMAEYHNPDELLLHIQLRAGRPLYACRFEDGISKSGKSGKSGIGKPVAGSDHLY